MNTFKANKRTMTPVIILALICILLKLLISFFFPLSRILMYLTLLIFAVYLIVLCIRRKNCLKQKIISVLIFCAVLGFSFLQIESSLDKAFFRLFENWYTAVAEDLTNELNAAEDTNWDLYELRFPESLLTRGGKEVLYIKKGEQLAIGFITVQTFFDLLTYTYFPEPNSADLITHTDSFEWINEHWAYVHWY